MNKPVIITLLIAFAASCHSNKKTTGSGSQPVSTGDSILNMKPWKLIAGDEFSAAAIDTSLWNLGVWYDESGDFAFKNENIIVSNGCLQLVAKKEKYRAKEYTIGAVESKFMLPAAPSLVRVKAKLLPDSVNVCTAIWLQTWPEVIANPNPEIDIIEYFQKDEMHMNLFTWNKDSLGNYKHVDYNGKIFDYKKDLSTDYHIYGLERRNGELRFYFDDRLVQVWEAPVPAFCTMPRHVVLSLEGHRYQPQAEKLPASFDIDWVRIYQR